MFGVGMRAAFKPVRVVALFLFFVILLFVVGHMLTFFFLRGY